MSSSDPADLQDRIRRWWNEDAAVYDRSASHAATDPVESAAWRMALERHLPSAPSRVLDVGAGTGAISLLAAELGHRVTALDLAAEMLVKAREKAEERGLEIEFVESSADAPPDGPFDAVVERHLLWTTPEPVATLEAWRRVAPEGRLILFEGLYGATGSLRRAVVEVVRKAMGTEHDHHAEYDTQILERLPLARAATPGPMLEAVGKAGWRAVRLERLHDVEWARQLASGGVLGRLETAPQFAIVADAA